MHRKIYVEVKAILLIDLDTDIELEDVISDMEYNFISNSKNAEIEDAEVTDWHETNF